MLEQLENLRERKMMMKMRAKNVTSDLCAVFYLIYFFFVKSGTRTKQMTAKILRSIKVFSKEAVALKSFLAPAEWNAIQMSTKWE